jgi:thymidylate kinase
MNSFLRRIFAALDEAKITYSLLRGFEELDLPAESSEVDLLVAPAHLPLLAKTFAANGFVALPAWGHAPHHFFVAYDRAGGSWLKFDVVTDLRYGKPFRTLRVDLLATCLQNRQRREYTYVFAPADEFFTLFLHCLLDKSNFRDARRERLIALRRQIGKDNEMQKTVAEYCARYLPPALTWDTFASAIDQDDWQSILQRRKVVARRLFQRAPIASAWRKISTIMLRRLRPLFFILRRRGVSVALLAPDGAGKSTLAQSLTKDNFLRAKLVYMGSNIAASTVGLPTTKWLHERLKARNGVKKKKKNLSFIALKIFSFINRLVEQWYRAGAALGYLLRGRLVVFDRYIYDSWLNKPATTPWKRLRRKMFESICPTPDLVVLLDAPGKMLWERKHEHTPEWLEQQRRGYLALKDRVPQMRVIDATQQAEVVKREVTAMIWAQHAAR